MNAEKSPLMPGEALDLLARPLVPLVGMLDFFMQTGGFVRVEEVLEQFPPDLETSQARYEEPAALLEPFLPLLRVLEPEGPDPPVVVDLEERPLPRSEARGLWARQQVLEAELERINSLCCGPCGCVLCCVGPDADMRQEFFEIPLHEGEEVLFACPRHESGEEPTGPLPAGALLDAPLLARRRTGWSLVLPRETRCPALDGRGRCRIYARRPTVCRRPQVFAYLLEPLGDGRLRARHSLLAVTDCPYVGLLRDEIAAYAAACELELVLRANKG